MKLKTSLFLLFGLCLLVVPVARCDDFDTDGIVEDENDPIVEQEIPVQKEAEEKVQYQSPFADPSKYYFAEHFDDLTKFAEKWIKSEAKKEGIEEEIAKYDGIWSVEEPQRSLLHNDLGLVLKSKAKHAAIASRLNKPFTFAGKPLVVQYEVTLQDGQECGGSYIKLLSSGAETTDLRKFHDKTPYSIMFGPDKCGNDVKLHFIFRHVNPNNGSIEEKNSKKPKDRLEEPFKDKQPHLYQLVINPDNTFKISVDHKLVNEGHLLKDFTPPVNPPKEIDDPNDTKPDSWDEREKIPDPTAVKPDDWDVPPQIQDPHASKPEGWLDDEEDMISDSNAQKPSDWDEEIDGVWEAPLIKNPVCENAAGCGPWSPSMIANPEYKGKWRAPLLDNPNYKGKWTPKRILNPDYFEDNDPFSRLTPISAVGIELWSMSSDILFDNIIITDNEHYAREWAQQTYDLKRKHLDKQAETFVQKIKTITNENPWIVALVVVVVGLPISIIVYMLCSASPKKEVQHQKKTDEPTEDDAEVDDIPMKSDKQSKMDLNEPEMDDQNEGAAEIDEQPIEPEAVDEEPASSAEPASSEEPEIKAPSEPTAARKRKPRKE